VKHGCGIGDRAWLMSSISHLAPVRWLECGNVAGSVITIPPIDIIVFANPYLFRSCLAQLFDLVEEVRSNMSVAASAQAQSSRLSHPLWTWWALLYKLAPLSLLATNRASSSQRSNDRCVTLTRLTLNATCQPISLITDRKVSVCPWRQFRWIQRISFRRQTMNHRKVHPSCCMRTDIRLSYDWRCPRLVRLNDELQPKRELAALFCEIV
jgi:hypothetical protein